MGMPGKLACSHLRKRLARTSFTTRRSATGFRLYLSVQRLRICPVTTRRAHVVVSALLVAGSLAACAGEDPIPAAPPGVAHVHGLGVNPADGTLYAATHHGLFRIPDAGPAVHVAERYQDTMGFTVVGPDHFLASGHPDPSDTVLRRPGRPPLLGLAESTDAGGTWRSASLLGEADFHALVAAHGLVYGFDATGGRFMVTADKKTWETRASIELGAFAVDPTDKDGLVASTGHGLAASGDGGRTWSRRAGPELTVLSWDAAGLFGATSSGAVFRSADGGGGWEQRGTLPGEPEALVVQGDAMYAAASSEGVTGIHRSSDGGRSWSLRYRDQA
jgi:hypothetical protein